MRPTRRTIQPERLRVLREDAGYSIAGLARAMEVGAPTYLGQVARGVTHPSPAYLKRIADALGRNLERTVGLDEFSTREPIDQAA